MRWKIIDREKEEYLRGVRDGIEHAAMAADLMPLKIGDCGTISRKDDSDVFRRFSAALRGTPIRDIFKDKGI